MIDSREWTNVVEWKNLPSWIEKLDIESIKKTAGIETGTARAP